jgi:hypothetical protein
MSLAALLVAGPAFAECRLTPSTEMLPFTYNQSPSAPTMGKRATRLYEFRVGGIVSAVDGQKLLDAADLGHLNPDADGNGEATLWFHTVIDDVQEIVEAGDCQGVVTGPKNLLLGYIYAANSFGGTELPIFAMLADGQLWSPGGEEDARFEIEMERKTGGELGFKSDVESGDGRFQIGTRVEIPADAAFAPNSADLYLYNFPFWIATSPELTDVPMWVKFRRMRYNAQPGDKVKIKTRNDDGVVCFNQLAKATGEDVCVTILRAEGGFVLRRNEFFSGRGLE